MISYDPADKRLGSYLIDAGLLTPSQVDVALNDQASTGMRFGDIVIERGWVKQQTIEYLYRKIIALEREIGQPLDKGVVQTSYSLRRQRKANPSP
jgi:deoxyribose-phosphate aldolase